MKGIPFRRPLWTVYRFWTNADGRLDGTEDIESFWDTAQALDVAARLNDANADPDVFYEAIESEAHGVYPAGEPPPWIPDPDRLARRGYESRSTRE